MEANCRLCGQVAELQLSHVLPAFVFKWQKKEGFIRQTTAPNRRVQDGPKAEWLCIGCEKRLNVWETEFANKVFHPLTADRSASVAYGEWLMKFCVSISWRALQYAETEWSFAHLSEPLRKKAAVAIRTWAEVLRGERPHPREFEQHILPLDVIESAKGLNLPPNINRYFLRAVEIDIASGSSTCVIFSKFGRFAVLGFVEQGNRRVWKDTKVHVRNGTIGPRSYRLPQAFLAYLMDRAERAFRVGGSISDAQNQKIQEAILANPEKFVTSQFFEAMAHDVRLFGDRAFGHVTVK